MIKKNKAARFIQITKSIKNVNSAHCLKILKNNTQNGVLRSKSISIFEKSVISDNYVLNFTDNYSMRYSIDVDSFITNLSKNFKKNYNKKNIEGVLTSVSYDFFNDFGIMNNNCVSASALYKKDLILDHEKTFYEIGFEVFGGYVPMFSKRNLLRKRQRSYYLHGRCSKVRCFKVFNDLFTILKNIKITANNFKESAKINQLKLYNARVARICIQRYSDTKHFPAVTFLKKTSGIYRFQNIIYETFEKDVINNEYRRYPVAQFKYIKKNINISYGYNVFFKASISKQTHNVSADLYKITWRYFKYKIERFFYNHLHVRLHIWFLNIWDIFINGIDTLWRWFRYEDATTYFLTKKGQQFIVESREGAKFYIRTMTLTLTMVGGAKLFLDNISLMMRRYRNNWAFIIHTTKSLRFCINYFWFRFFVNYKITLQGKIGGFLRAQKKIFKKGNVSIENKQSAITYYRGFPVTRFGSYNLSFWLQYRIPNLIEKFDEMEYIDTMKILLSMYTIPWLAKRLSKIISTMLIEHINKVKRKVAQYNRRISTREVLLYDILKVKKYFFKKSGIKSNHQFRYKKLKNMLISRKNYKKIFKKSIYKKAIQNLNNYKKKVNA